MSNSRRQFIETVVGGVSAAAIGSAFSNFCGRIRASDRFSAGAMELLTTKDQTTGLPLIKLPDGFRYLSYGWTNEPLQDGTPTPGAHDGMAVIAETEDEFVLCRNHELDSSGKSLAARDMCYDPFALGGCTNLVFDRIRGEFRSASTSLSGTIKNCAGGATPWGTWLSCEETVWGPGDKLDKEVENHLTKPHGFVFEVPVQGLLQPQPIESLGRFVHEAVAVDPDSGIVYLTEDAGTAGLYRFVPIRSGDLKAGGRFEMMACKNVKDVRKNVSPNQMLDVHWVEIPDRSRAHSPGTNDGLGVYHQGRESGGLTFARLEGCAIHDGRLFVTATSGGNAAAGQVWEYNPKLEQLKLLFESPSLDILDMPDNMAVSPRGGILLCEDGKLTPQRLQILTTDGKLFPFASNNITLDGLHGHRGNFRSSEWAGACFSRDGQWLFVNIQTPGVTLAITGPWQDCFL